MKILQTIVICSICSFTFADTTLTFSNDKDNVAMKMQFANNMMRVTSAGDSSTFMIYDANSTTFTTFIAEKKQYFVMDKETLEKLGDINAMMEKMLEKQLANVPESQREMMRNMMSSSMKTQMSKPTPKAQYSFTGTSASYNGFDCKVVIKESDKESSEFCVTNYSDLGMSSSEYSIITSFQRTIGKLAKQYGTDKSMDFSSLGDFVPVKYSQAGETGILKSVNHDKLDASLFAIPEGYSRMEMPF